MVDVTLNQTKQNPSTYKKNAENWKYFLFFNIYNTYLYFCDLKKNPKSYRFLSIL